MVIQGGFTDRVPNSAQTNQRKIEIVSGAGGLTTGTVLTAKITYDDNPSVAGTPLSADTFNNMQIKAGNIVRQPSDLYRKIYISENGPSGMSEGDIWIQYQEK